MKRKLPLSSSSEIGLLEAMLLLWKFRGGTVGAVSGNAPNSKAWREFSVSCEVFQPQQQSVMFKPEKTAVERKRPPPVKVLSGQLRTADSRDGFVIKPASGRSLRVSLVWMQGTVLEVQLDRNTALLMDETGTFAVQDVKNVPKGKPCLSEGQWELETKKWVLLCIMLFYYLQKI